MNKLAVIALVTAIASPAIAQAPQARDHNPMIAHPSAETVGPPIVRKLTPDEAFARVGPRHSPNAAWDVYGIGGRYKGSDADPLVRDAIRRDKLNTGD